MATIRNIIESALLKINALDPGESINGNEAGQNKDALYQMVDAWSNENLLVPVTTVITHPLVVDETEYTIGVYGSLPIPTTHIETPRPQQILSAFIRDSQGTDYSVTEMAYNQWSSITRKTNIARPSRYYKREGYPSDTLIFETNPYQADVLHLEAILPFTAILPVSTLNDVVALPPGYEQALVYNLAIDLAGSYGKDIGQFLFRRAEELKMMLKRQNLKLPTMEADRGLQTRRGSYGEYYIEKGP